MLPAPSDARPPPDIQTPAPVPAAPVPFSVENIALSCPLVDTPTIQPRYVPMSQWAPKPP